MNKGRKGTASAEAECARAVERADRARQRALGALLLAALVWHRPWRALPEAPNGVPSAYRVDVARDAEGVLTLLGGVGPKLASRIAAWRADRSVRSLEELLEVKGIGPVTLERIRAEAWVGPIPAPAYNPAHERAP